jgi:cation-transporting ATPase 13A1
VRLGDASIAAPFTSRVPDISCVLAILRQGRCTLVTTLQVMAILGVNSLIFAYRLSVLHVDGVKLSDAQMTASGLAVALFFLFTSRAKSVHELSRERPQTRIFSVPFFASLLGQFALHFGALLLAVEWARPFTPTDPETRSPDAKFSPNVLNSVVFLLSSSQVVATFFANYRGRPFMISLRENRPLLYMLLASEAVLLLAVLGYVPALSAYLELTLPASLEFQNNLALLLLVDLVGSVAIARAVTRLCPKLSAWEVPPDEPPAGKRA